MAPLQAAQAQERYSEQRGGRQAPRQSRRGARGRTSASARPCRVSDRRSGDVRDRGGPAPDREPASRKARRGFTGSCDALAGHGIPRDKIFSEKISTRVRVRPQFEAALAAAREIKAHAPHCRVIFTVNEMKRLGRDASELTALADHLTAHGLVLEMLAGPLQGMYDPSGPGRLLFGFFADLAARDDAPV
ncbi:recombinase family protein [Streptomyces sp. 769]|uniref:recombinase family protein n=1 Tax=Streptomyces sp. 769 TaxID=1262452 RepID=UPI001EEF9409|nr:recombinase family protein [Streptomyces sp. 769]